MRGRLLPMASIAVGLLLAAGDVRADPDPARARRGFDYVVTVSPDLSRATVRLCFRRFLPRTLVVNQAGAAAAIAPRTDPGTARLRRRGERSAFDAVGLRSGGCVAYDVDLQALSRLPARRGRARVGRDLLLDPGLLLLRPAVWPRGIHVTCRFHCAPPSNVCVPWPSVPGARTPHTYQLLPRSLDLDAVIAIGRFPTHALKAAGATFRIARLDAPLKTSREELEAWIAAAAGAVAPLFGRYPAPEVQVLVQPSSAARTPVLFGRARKAGGAGTIFYVSATADRASLVGEWVAVHEMIHLGMPWTVEGDAWFQEGFTTYYQEVLRARAGMQTALDGWRELHAGFGRGQRGGRDTTLAESSRGMHRTHAYWRVYWGGAAIALEVDVAIRHATQGRRCLDDVIRHLHRNQARAGRAFTGRQLLAAADAYLGRPICVPIAERALAGKGMPDLSVTYRALGLRVDGDGDLQLDPSAPLAAFAASIMAPPAAQAPR